MGKFEVSPAKSLRSPKVRVSTTRTRTVFYVDVIPRLFESAEDPSALADELQIVVYLDTDDEGVIARTLERVDALRELAGYGTERDIEVRRGSIFRRSRAAVQRGLSSKEVQDRLLKLERAVELAVVDNRQAEYDATEAAAVQQVIESLQDIPRACIRVGSIFIVKYPVAGEAVLLVRNLSQLEMRALDRFPEIQTKPEYAFRALTTAMLSMDPVRAGDDLSGHDGTDEAV